MTFRLRDSLAAATLFITACGADAPAPPPVVDSLLVSIDADNNCSLEKKPVECSQVASVIHGRYPTSKPRVDICIDKQARYEPAMEVLQSVNAAGFTGSFDCGKPAAG
jgi:biopolymer transport protein ExbD